MTGLLGASTVTGGKADCEYPSSGNPTERAITLTAPKLTLFRFILNIATRPTSHRFTRLLNIPFH
jgi:hypothetical protein